MAIIDFFGPVSFDPSSTSLGSNFLRILSNSNRPYEVVVNSSSEWTIRTFQPAPAGIYVFLPATTFVPGPSSQLTPPAGIVGSIGQFSTTGQLVASWTDLAPLGLTIAQLVANPSLLVSRDDDFLGDDAGQTFYGGAGDDILSGRGGVDRLFGEAGSDEILGGSGNDVLDGGSGDDYLAGGTGDDTIIGGAGFDFVDYFEAVSGVTVRLGVTTPQDTVGGGIDTLSGIEAVAGSPFNDTLIGTSELELFFGAAGADAIDGAGGLDIAGFQAAAAGATFARQVSGAWVVTTGVDGADTLTNIEYITFSDRTFATRPAEGTLDGNGTSDILLRSTSGQLAAWSMNGAAVTNAAIIGVLDPVYSQAFSGDFNGDGRFDYVARVPSSLLQVVLLNGSAATAAATYAPSSSDTLVGVGDFNGDFRDDLLFRSSTGVMSQWQMDGVTPTIGTFASSDTSWTVAQIADFNGDGFDDILWRNSSGLLAQWEMDGFSVTRAAVFAVSDPTWSIVGTGDFNGDLREDIMWRSSGGLMALWTMDGLRVTAVGTFAGSDTAWQVSDIGDYNGDGRDDILWQSPDGTFAVWTLNGFAVTSAAVVGNAGQGWTDFG